MVTGSAGNTVAGTAGWLARQILVHNRVGWRGRQRLLRRHQSGAENAASTVDYRCEFVRNLNGANALQNAVLYLSAEVGGGATIAIGVDPTAASPIGQAGAQAVQIANETTAPAGVTFFAPVTAGTGLIAGDDFDRAV